MASEMLSLIVPVYNGTMFLRKTLDSLENQDYEQIELILVDDGSKDESLNIMRTFAMESKRTVKIITQRNSGVCAARNAGFSVAVGKYVAFCDQDDLFARKCFSKLIDALEKNDADIAFCGFDFIDADDNIIGRYEKSYVYPKYNPLKGEDILSQYLLGKVAIWGGAILYRRNFLLDNKILYTRNCIFAEDNEFFIKSLAVAERVACVRESLSFWRQHKYSTSTSYSFKQIERNSNLHELTAYLRCRAFLEKRGKQNTNAYKILTSLIIPSAYVAYLQRVLLIHGDVRLKEILHQESLRSQLKKGNNFIFLTKRPDLYFKLFLAIYFPGAFLRLVQARQKRKFNLKDPK